MNTNDTLTLKKLPQVPPWLIRMFAEIDNKRFGPDFDAVFAPDAEMDFGVGKFKGLADIKAHLQKFDSVMDTKHVVLDFWDAGAVKFVRGEVSMTRHETPGETLTPTFVHVYHMSGQDPERLQLLQGAVGPMEV